MPIRHRIGLCLRSRPADGGVFQYATSILRALAALPRDRFEVVVAYTQPDVKPYIDAYDIESYPIRISRTIENWTGLATSLLLAARIPASALRAAAHLDPLASALRRLRCDLWVFPAGDSVVYRSDVRSVAVVHDLMHRYEPRFPEVGRWPIRTRRELHYRALCASADRLVADSELGAQHIAESYHVGGDGISVLPFAVPDRNDGHAESDETIEGLPDHYFYYPAQYWPHKNHVNLARAVRLLVDRGVDTRVVLSGGPAGSHRTFAAAARAMGVADRFTELGYVPAGVVAGLYRGATGLVYPSYFGPTNIPPLEALHFETPMAVSGNYAMREQLADAALYFDPDSPAGIADAMAQIAEHPATRSALVAAGRRLIHRHTPQVFAARLRRIVEEVLEGRPPVRDRDAWTDSVSPPTAGRPSASLP